MKNKRFNQRGITLIALVVTIIVLIILAGISIALLFGENGIIEKAKDAGTKYGQAANEEDRSLSDIDSQIDSILNDYGMQGGSGDNNNGNGGNGNSGNNNGNGNENSNEAPITGALGTAVNVEKYGEKVLNYTAAGLVWRLFYEDSNNIYLISETQDGHYPLTSQQLCDYNGSSYIPKSSKYVSGDSVSAQGKALMPMASSLFVSTNTNANMLGTAYLCDTDNDGPWTAYKTGSAAWAMGSPIIELFAASYNATHQGGNQISLTVNQYGYGGGPGSTVSPEWFVNTDHNGIYCIGSGAYSVYWLASPCYEHPSEMRCVMAYYGSFGVGDVSLTTLHLRPVVCIPKSTGFTISYGEEV